MIVLTSPQLVQQTSLRWKKKERVGLVPTMGCLHDGHLALVETAKQLAERCIVSIFVNPLQFGPSEDFEKYPRSLEEDMQKLESLGVDLLFAPSVRDMYPPDDYHTHLRTEGPLTNHLCGKSRPGHFSGVATVCTKLFLATQADLAIFGEKDFQQLRVIQQLTGDLHLPISILPHPVVREADQLAMSSRNRYLSPADREIAPRLYQGLNWMRSEAAKDRTLLVGDLRRGAKERLSHPGIQIEYLEICSEKDLQPVEDSAKLFEVPAARAFVAAKLGSTRLIDNLSLTSTPEGG